MGQGAVRKNRNPHRSPQVVAECHGLRLDHPRRRHPAQDNAGPSGLGPPVQQARRLCRALTERQQGRKPGIDHGPDHRPLDRDLGRQGRAAALDRHGPQRGRNLIARRIDQPRATALQIHLQHRLAQNVLPQHQGCAQSRRLRQRPQVEDGGAQAANAQRPRRQVQRHPAPDLRLAANAIGHHRHIKEGGQAERLNQGPVDHRILGPAVDQGRDLASGDPHPRRRRGGVRDHERHPAAGPALGEGQPGPTPDHMVLEPQAAADSGYGRAHADQKGTASHRP